METTRSLVSLLAIEQLVRLDIVSREVLLDILSKVELGSSAVECCLKITALLHILRRESACLDLTTMFSLEIIDKLSKIWLDSIRNRPELENQKEIIISIMPDERLILDVKLCLVYDRWTGSPLIESEELKRFIENQAFVNATNFQTSSRDECLRAAENKKDPFRSAIWAIASRSTINERILKYCTASLNLLGGKTTLERIVEDHLAGRYRMLSDSPVLANVINATAPSMNMGYSPFSNHAGVIPDSITMHDIQSLVANLQGAPIDAVGSFGMTAKPGMVTMGSGNRGNTDFRPDPVQPQNFTDNTSNNPASLTFSVTSDDSLPDYTKDARRNSGRKRRPNNPWTREEETALKKGIVKFGPGSWARIHREYMSILERRTQVDLKDKWRNMCRCKSPEGIQAMLAEVHQSVESQSFRAVGIDGHGVGMIDGTTGPVPWSSTDD